MLRSFCVLLLIYLGCITPLTAEEVVVLDEELQELITLDVADLSNINVSVASKFEEKIQDAPGIVTVITAEEIQRYGYRNLRDILDRQTHIQIIGSNVFPHGKVSMRGNALVHTDNSVLPLINGRPLLDGSGVSNNQDLYNNFPVEAIKQIEIIRGPGSVLYGTNAFAGVINIITKDAPDSPSGEATFTYGSFDTIKGTISGGGKWGDFEIFGSVNTFDSDGDDFNNIIDEFGTPGTYKTGADGQSAVFQAKYKGFTLNGLFTNTAQDQLRSTFVFPASELNTERQYVNLGYQHNITDNWDISVNGSYQHHEFDFFLNAVPIFQFLESDSYFVEVTTRAKLTDKLNILAGGSYREVDGLILLNPVEYNTSTVSAYAQVDYWLFDWLKLTGGIQYNEPEQLSGEFSPRVGAIAQINKQWGIKLLYGEAFREASPAERFLDVTQVVGDPLLEPETIETFDAQLSYHSDRGSFAATYFHSNHKALITRTGTLPQQIVNAGEMELDGFELEGNLDLGHGFSFIGNMSYQNEDGAYSPDWMVKTGLSYDSPRGATVSLFNSYFRASTLQNRDINPTVAEVNPEADGYNLLTANLRINVGKFFRQADLNGINFSIYGDNLLDEAIFFPSISRVTVNSIPHHQGRGFYGTISVEF